MFCEIADSKYGKQYLRKRKGRLVQSGNTMQVKISRLNFLPFTFIEKKTAIRMDFTALIFCRAFYNGKSATGWGKRCQLQINNTNTLKRRTIICQMKFVSRNTKKSTGAAKQSAILNFKVVGVFYKTFTPYQQVTPEPLGL